MPAPPTAIPPVCPRCGYDQSGVVGTWAEACPLRGVCSECGLELSWALVLSPEIMGPRWSVEHGHRLTFARLGRAFACAIWQRHLWRKFDLAYPIRAQRLWALVLVSLLVQHLLLAGVLAIGAAVDVGFGTSPWMASIWVVPYNGTLSVPLSGGQTAYMSVGPIVVLAACTLIVPSLVILVFTQSMSKVGVRPEHVLRGFAYAAPAVGPVVVLLLLGFAILVAAMHSFARPGAPWPIVPGIALLVSWPLCQTLRWRAFVKHYLRLPHANWIALSLFIILGLSTHLAVSLAASAGADW